MTIPQEQDSSIDPSKYWYIIKRRWKPTLIVIASVFGLTAIVTFSQKPIYESQGRLVFTKRDTASSLSSLTNIADKLGDLGGLTNTSNPIDTESEIIRSYPIVSKTINSLELKNSAGDVLSTDSFLKNLNLKTLRGTDVLQVSYRSTNPQEATNVVNAMIKYYLDSNVNANRTEARSAKEFLSSQLPQVEEQVKQAEANLRSFKEKNKLVALDVEAKSGLESLSKLYATINEIQGQLAALETRSSSLQNEMKLNTQEAIDLTALSQSASVQQALTEYQSIQRDVAVARTTYSDQHPAVISLILKEEALKKELESRVTQTIGSSMSLSQQSRQVGLLTQSLTQDLVKSEVEKLALRSQLEELQKIFTEDRKRLDSLPKLEQEQIQLQRQLSVVQGTYEQLLKQLQLVQIIESQNVGNARLIEEAVVPSRAVSPVIHLNLGLGGFLAILLGLGTALVLESMDKSLKNIEEAKLLLDLPLLGTVPLITGEGNIGIVDSQQNSPLKSIVGSQQNSPLKSIVDSQQNSPLIDRSYAVSNSFEIIQTNLNFSLPDQKLQVILVTSATAGEGKSFVASNLASVMAKRGKRVLLVDADMRRPSQHKIWKVFNVEGLSNILINQTYLEDAILHPLPNLDLLTAGTYPPNPIALLDSHSMKDLIDKARSHYDFVIIDTPPLMAVADPLVISKLVDGILLVVRLGQVYSEEVSMAKSLLDQSKIPVLGMMLNGINEQNSYGGYYYYGRNYYLDKEDK
jgi:capsular exopolysaccharide synthesis family protein